MGKNGSAHSPAMRVSQAQIVARPFRTKRNHATQTFSAAVDSLAVFRMFIMVDGWRRLDGDRRWTVDGGDSGGGRFDRPLLDACDNYI